jgi:hypothetical protein
MSVYLIKRLIEWATDNGAYVDPALKFVYSKEKGVHAIAAISTTGAPRTPQLKIPETLIIHGNLASQVLGNDVYATETIQNGAVKLLLCKIKYDTSETDHCGRDLAQFFSPYIDLLPVGKQTNSPFYWKNDEAALLKNTNLGGSLNAKLTAILDEWYVSVKTLPEKFRGAQFDSDMDFYAKFRYLDGDEVIEEVLNHKSWTSFGAYLWASIIFTSRAFPHKIIDDSAKDGQAMLLPLIDLLNHDNSTKIDWKYEVEDKSGYFSLHSYEPYQEGCEIFNNYGAKGNEELLMGYGFVIPDNLNDSVALRLPAPREALERALAYDIYLPTIDDYTHHAFDASKSRSKVTLDELEVEGLLYYLNKNSLMPEMLLEFSMIICLNDKELGSFPGSFTVRAKLEALHQLRSALEFKSKGLMEKNTEITTSDPGLTETAKIYMNGQKHIYKASISELKGMEKELLHIYRSHIWNLKKIFKKDPRFREVIQKLGFQTSEEAERSGDSDIYVAIWILMSVLLPNDEYQPVQWILDEFRKIAEDLISFPRDEIKSLMVDELKEALEGHALLEFIDEEKVFIAERVTRLHSYTRYNSGEIILVEPMALN